MEEEFVYVYIVVGPKLEAFVKLSNEEENQTLKSRIQRSVSAFFSPGRLDMERDVWEWLWDRFLTARTVQQMMETMERMMEDPFVYTNGWPSPTLTETGEYSRGRTPWEIKEGEGEYKMRFDMPGMTKDDVKVYVEEKMLVVKAEKMAKDRNGQESEVENEEWSVKSQGRYSSRVALTENVEFEKIKAEVKDGVLYTTIPKASGTSKVLDINVQRVVECIINY
ncbi:unnamed protein product [Camellia sinensis]